MPDQRKRSGETVVDARWPTASLLLELVDQLTNDADPPLDSGALFQHVVDRLAKRAQRLKRLGAGFLPGRWPVTARDELEARASRRVTIGAERHRSLYLRGR